MKAHFELETREQPGILINGEFFPTGTKLCTKILTLGKEELRQLKRFLGKNTEPGYKGIKRYCDYVWEIHLERHEGRRAVRRIRVVLNKLREYFPDTLRSSILGKTLDLLERTMLDLEFEFPLLADDEDSIG